MTELILATVREATLFGDPVLQVGLLVPAATVSSPVISIWSLVAGPGLIGTFALEATAASPAALVLTVKPALASPPEAAKGFVMPAIVTHVTEAPGSEHAPPLFEIVMVTVVPTVPPAAVQLLNPGPSPITGAAGTVNTAGKTTVIVLLLPRPVAIWVKLTCQVVGVCPAYWSATGLAANETLAAAGSMTYGSGSDASSKRSRRNCAPPRRASDQCSPLGVTAPPRVLRSSAGAIRSPESRPLGSKNPTVPSPDRRASRPEVSSRQLQLRRPCRRSTWNSCSAPEPPTVTNSRPKLVGRVAPPV